MGSKWGGGVGERDGVFMQRSRLYVFPTLVGWPSPGSGGAAERSGMGLNKRVEVFARRAEAHTLLRIRQVWGYVPTCVYVERTPLQT